MVISRATCTEAGGEGGEGAEEVGGDFSAFLVTISGDFVGEDATIAFCGIGEAGGDFSVCLAAMYL